MLRQHQCLLGHDSGKREYVLATWQHNKPDWAEKLGHQDRFCPLPEGGFSTGFQWHDSDNLLCAGISPTWVVTQRHSVEREAAVYSPSACQELLKSLYGEGDWIGEVRLLA